MTATSYPDIDPTDRLAVNRLRSAAKRGDARAEATLRQIEQQKHTAAWQEAEQRRADLAAQRASRKRYTSVASMMDELRRRRTKP